MKQLRYVGINLLHTLLRVLPFPCRTGLIRIGDPGRHSPVLLTGNYRLTVERVKWALAGVDAYLLVANSRGFNVWCGAAGGHLTHHEVISVLKTSGIEAFVDHRQLILPQLAAAGIEGRAVQQKSGWQVVWGPVEAAAVPTFLGEGLRKTAAMREVSFPWPRRLELAVVWAFPISLLSLVLYPFWREAVIPLISLIWGGSLLIFLSFPLYQGHLRKPGRNVGLIFFNFGSGGVLLFLWGLFFLALVIGALFTGNLSWDFTFRWGLSSFLVVLVLGIDLKGSTPVCQSGLHEDRLLRISLDSERCRGAGFCRQVCPRNVFEVDRSRHLATLPGEERCIRCGACIVQCPFDALYFLGPEGEVVTPDTIRRFKLNLLGKRPSPPGKRG